jgi:hypothetical protein
MNGQTKKTKHDMFHNARGRMTNRHYLLAGKNEVFIVDTESHSIRWIDTKTGLIHWVAGVPTSELTRLEKGPASQIRFAPGEMARPHGVWVDKPECVACIDP